ncbi:MAG: hypothetical protein JO161_02200, partial [Planctomycetaceae bacterium]|nr:hypothetical protein [Planctomycetaceae bacterium]
MSITESVAVDQELIEVLLKALEKAQEPVTAEKVRQGLSGPYKRPIKVIAEHLNELVRAGKAFQFEPSGRSKQRKFWSRSETVDQGFIEDLLQALSQAQEPVTAENIRKAL